MDSVVTAQDGGLAGCIGASVGLTDVEKHYDTVGAVRGVSLSVRPGEFLTLLGPSGSGKTTTLMMIAGFETPSAGDISIDGRSVVALPPHRRGIGMVFQSYALFPHMTVAENIAFPLKQRGISRAERVRLVDEALALVHLPDTQRRYPRQLSGGQQQRVALARAIVFRPRLLLMDEPLGALDKQLRERMQLELRRLHAELGITFVYVTHDQEEALTMSDRIAVMNHGLIEQIGTPNALYDRPENRFVASFIGESNVLSATCRGIDDGFVVACRGETLLRAVGRPETTDVTLIVRPERLRFRDDTEPPAGCNLLRVQVLDTVFAGETYRYQCVCDDGTAIVVKAPSGAGVRRRTQGEMADIVWSAEDTVVV
jgi:spermidine/putrescine ABC transporter ATP-binding subunit